MKRRALTGAFLAFPFLLAAEAGAVTAPTLVAGSLEQESGESVAGAAGAALVYAGGIELKVAPWTRFRFHVDEDLWLDNAGRTPTHVISLISGQLDVYFVSEDAPKRAVLVRTTQNLSAAATSGHMSVICQEAQGIVANYFGIAIASRGSARWVEVPPGKLLVWEQNHPAFSWADVPTQPQVSGKQRVWMSERGYQRVGGFEWLAIAGAEKYLVTLTSGDGTKITDATVSNHLPAMWQKLPAGAYELVVQAVGRAGLRGPPSEAYAFYVVGVATGGGVSVDSSGCILLLGRRDFEFQHVEGLLMSYGSAENWVPATPSVAVRPDERTAIHFKFPGADRHISSWVQPVIPRASIRVGPKTAIWPKSDVRVVVEYVVPGQHVNMPEISVSAGTTRLHLKWRKQNGRWWARVPPQSGRGPWVIRAAVKDLHGGILARDFLEVVAAR